MRLRILFALVAFVAKMSPTLAQTDSVCASYPYANYHVNGSVGSTFLWDTYGYGTILSGQGNDSVRVQWNNVPGTYSISVKEKNANGCEGVLQTLNVVVYQSSHNIDAHVCEGDKYVLPNGTTVSDSGSYSFILTSASGCDSVVTIRLSFYPSADAVFELPQGPGISNSSVVPVDPSLYNVSWYWNFGDGTYDTSQYPIHHYNTAGQFLITLMVVNSYGCKGTYQMETVVSSIYIPNSFTPNGDGNNDIFLVYGLGIKTINLKIFDRWGEKIFETNDSSEGWDGIFKNQPAPMAVYVYVADVTFSNGTTEQYEGSITLIR